MCVDWLFLLYCPANLLQVQRDYEELPADAVPQLRDSLLQLLLKFGTGSPAVRVQLCLALAALAAHLPAAQWGEGGVLKWLMDRMNGQDPSVALSCMLELLTVLPQVREWCASVYRFSARMHSINSKRGHVQSTPRQADAGVCGCPFITSI